MAQPAAFTGDLLCRQQRQPAGDSEHAAARETNHDGALHPPGQRDPGGDPGEIPGGHQSRKECGLGAVGLNLGLKGGGNEWKIRAKLLQINGRHDWIRTSDLFRVKSECAHKTKDLQPVPELPITRKSLKM